jgi:predicted TPR repeat methyltransferase
MTPVSLPQIEIDNLIKLFSQGRTQEVIDKIQVLDISYPNIPLLFNILGACHKNLGNLALATKIFEHAIALKPDYAEAHYNLGVTLKQDGQLIAAVESYKKSIALLPDYADAHNNLGTTLSALGQKDDAIKCYEKVIALNPNYAEAHFNLGSTLRELGKLEAAIKSFETALIINPNYDEAKHFLNGLIGYTSKAPPREYVENLFDGFAEKFNDSLLNKLEYNLPFLVNEIILNLSVERKIFDKVIDLGCGTGLSGKGLKALSGNLTGIDLSEKMIAKAKKLNIYDSLIVGDIVEILSSSKSKYDLLIALDVLIYIGEVKALFKAVRSCCNINAFFIFSVETKIGDGYSLLKTARYSHSENYILNSASEDFNLIESQEIKLRKEKEGWVLGKIYIFQAS